MFEKIAKLHINERLTFYDIKRVIQIEHNSQTFRLSHICCLKLIREQNIYVFISN